MAHTTTITHVCDRCGRQQESDWQGSDRLPPGWDHITRSSGKKGARFDLCNVCSDSLDEFVRNHPVDTDGPDPMVR